ncbi:hypothetical protein KAT51_00530 [bacterium]|nr:hypothetical protein [bacterium]
MSINIKEFGKLENYIPRDTKKKSERVVKEARKEHMREYNKKHRKVIAAKQKKYNKEHKEEIITNGKEYYDKNKEKIIEYSKAYKVRTFILGSFGEEGFSIQLSQDVNVNGKVIGVGNFRGPRTPEQNRKNTLKHKIKNATVLKAAKPIMYLRIL